MVTQLQEKSQLLIDFLTTEIRKISKPNLDVSGATSQLGS